MAIVQPVSIGSRVHITNPFEWDRSPATDYWLAATNHVAAAATFPDDLADYGWVTTSVLFTAGSAADFITSADVGIPRSLGTDAASDILQSPVMFGDYAHALQAKQFLGYLPTKLCAEFYAQFNVASAAETATTIGFVEAGGSPVTAAGADTMASFYSDATNFKLESGAGASAAGALISTTYHLWKIVLDVTTQLATGTMDGGNAITVALQTDLFPVSFGLGTVAAGTNRIQLSFLHIWYE